jgi:predicted nucleic acid-binding protein
MMVRRPTGRGLPAHLVLDSEGLSQLSAPRPAKALLIGLEAAAATGGRVVVPTTVMVEQRFDRTASAAAAVNRRLRIARTDGLDEERAAFAVRLLLRVEGPVSVVDGHVAATALHHVRAYGGTATIATSDPGDLGGLLSGHIDISTASDVTVLPL